MAHKKNRGLALSLQMDDVRPAAGAKGVWSTRAELQGVTCSTMACLKHCLKQQSETAGKGEGSCNYSPQLTPEPVTTTESLVLNQKQRTGAFSLLGEGCNPLQLQYHSINKTRCGVLPFIQIYYHYFSI